MVRKGQRMPGKQGMLGENMIVIPSSGMHYCGNTLLVLKTWSFRQWPHENLVFSIWEEIELFFADGYPIVRSFSQP